MVMKYKIRHNKNQPVRYIVLRCQTAFSVIICGGRETKKHGLDMRGYMQG